MYKERPQWNITPARWGNSSEQLFRSWWQNFENLPQGSGRNLGWKNSFHSLWKLDPQTKTVKCIYINYIRNETIIFPKFQKQLLGENQCFIINLPSFAPPSFGSDFQHSSLPRKPKARLQQSWQSSWSTFWSFRVWSIDMRASVGKKTSVVRPIFWFNIRPNLVGYLSAWHRIGMIVTLTCEGSSAHLPSNPSCRSVANRWIQHNSNIKHHQTWGLGQPEPLSLGLAFWWDYSAIIQPYFTDHFTNASATSIGSSKGQQWWHRGRSGRMSKASGTSTAVVATSWALANSSGRSSNRMVISLGLLKKMVAICGLAAIISM